jgi:hypothetical protein
MTPEERHLLIVLAGIILRSGTITKIERTLLAHALLPFRKYIDKLGE